jgi:hypothetical protein
MRLLPEHKPLIIKRLNKHFVYSAIHLCNICKSCADITYLSNKILNIMITDILAKLRRLQLDHAYQPAEVAEYLKIDLTTYNRMINGQTDTWHKYLSQLLDFYKMTPPEFFQDIQGKNFVSQTNQQENKDSASGKIIGNIENLTMESTAFNKLITELEESRDNYKRKYYTQKDKLVAVEEKLALALSKIRSLEQNH